MILHQSEMTAFEWLISHRNGLNTCNWRLDAQLEKIRSSIHPNISDTVLESGLTGEMEAAELPAQDWKRAEKVDKDMLQRTMDKFPDSMFHL